MTAASEPLTWTIAKTAEKLAAKAISSVELTQAYLARVEAENPSLNAYITVDREGALAQAQAADRRRAQGETGPLLGVPVALKDNMCSRGVKTTCGSRILENFVAPYDAHVVERLRGAGAVFLGKTNMDEFAMGSSTEHSFFGPSRNPHDLERVPGGSSGGSASAMAAHLCAGALGSDTGGSIRQPAACCGIVGLKPTYGRVSRYGLVAFASSLDQIGPMTQDVRDAAILLDGIAGPDHRDSTCSADAPPSYAEDLKQADAQPNSLKGVKLAIAQEHFVEGGLAPDVAERLRETIETYRSLGAEIVQVSLPHSKHAIATYYLVATAEASSNLARYDGVHYGRRAKDVANIMDLYSRSRGEGFGDEVKRRIMLGTYALSAGYYDAYYLRALKVRTLIKRDFEKVFADGAHALLTPVTPSTAFRFGENVSDPLKMYLSDIFTIAINLAGVPAISVPCGAGADGLPAAFQLVAPIFAEDRLFRLGRAFERAATA
jgi:aspartyl-tRNA(Asn)/glutamyl-tRNA(Gln) amidotransferase subunit A